MKHPWPALSAFDRGDEWALWLWTYRVWNGWKVRHATWSPYP